MRINFSSFSIMGPKKNDNEDSLVAGVFSAPIDGAYFAIADGVGGLPGGGDAAKIATTVFAKLIGENPELALETTFHKISSAIEEQSKNQSGCSDMSTTLSVCVVKGSTAYVGHVGDTRVYHLRNAGILLRTEDQTEVNVLLAQGVISKERARQYPRRNVLVSALSSKNEHTFYSSIFEVQSGDRLLLSSDGLHKIVQTRDIRDISLQSQNADEFAQRLRAEAERRGVRDDCSTICVAFD